MRVVIAGASGFLGTHLSDHLRVHGHEVTALVRREPTSARESRWDPSTGDIDAAAVARADAVVNLAGASIAANPHSKAYAREVMDSRVSTTRLLAETIAAAERPPAFIAGNGISWYGDHGGRLVTEDTGTTGDAFLTRMARAWEEATRPAQDAGARVDHGGRRLDRRRPGRPVRGEARFQRGDAHLEHALVRRSGGERLQPQAGLVDRAHQAVAIVAGPEPDELIADRCDQRHECDPRQDALELTWLTPEDALSPSILNELEGGRGFLLRQALAHLGAV